MPISKNVVTSVEVPDVEVSDDEILRLPNTGIIQEDVSPKKRKPRKSKDIVTEGVAVKAPPQSTDFVIVLLRLDDGRILAIGDRESGDEKAFRAILDRNATSLFGAFQVNEATDIGKYMTDKYVFYISEILV